MHSLSRRYIPGNRLVECDRCGFGYRFSEMRREQALGAKNLIVCANCYDGPHPQDTPPRTRPEGRLEVVR